MNYLEILRAEAEKKVKPLAVKVATLKKQLAVLIERADSEKADLATAEETLTQLKNAAGSYLTEGPNAFDRFKTNLKRTTGRVETLRESIRIFTTELVPAKKAELDAARNQLQRATTAFYRDQLPACESRLTELLGQVVAEYDGFTAAFAQLRMDYGTNFNGELPHAAHVRIDGTNNYGMSDLKWVTFTPPPAVRAAAAPAAPATSPAAAVSACPGRAESPPTGAREESVAFGGPRGETMEPAENPQEAAPADLDPGPLPLAVDAEVEAELDAEAPPEVG